MAHHLVKSMARRQREIGATHHHHRISHVSTPGAATPPKPTLGAEPTRLPRATARHPRPRRSAAHMAREASHVRRPLGETAPKTEQPLQCPRAPIEARANNNSRTSTRPNHDRSRGADGLGRRTWTGEAAGGDISTVEPHATTFLPVGAQRNRGRKSPSSPKSIQQQNN
jgi:hypothetical protein